MKNGIAVAYTGVHQAFQLALAADELGRLDQFYCSVLASPGKWGGVLARLLGPDILMSRRLNGLSPKKACENPWPLLIHHCRARLLPKRSEDWARTNSWFDHWVARRLRNSDCSIFVGVETCARDSFRIASKRRMTKVLDCPQVHPKFLARLFAEAADDLGVSPPEPFDSPELAARKAEEYELADQILTLSEVHRRSFVEAGFPKHRLVEIPLWVDPGLWFPMPVFRKGNRTSVLKVVFVGNIGLRKGIPYLARAIDQCRDRVQLTLVGVNSGESDKFIQQCSSSIHYAGRKNKAELRRIYWESDVLVLPSIIDTFGFVALEAMACGLPVIVTENCGVPVPDPSWRVPIMDSDAIARRLALYAEDRDLCRYHGVVAADFAAHYAPSRYREQVKTLYRQLLGLPLELSSYAESTSAAAAQYFAPAQQ